MKNFHKTSNASNKEPSRYSRNACTFQNIELVRNFLPISQGCLVEKYAQSLGVSHESPHRILCRDPHYHRFKLAIT